MAFIFNVFCISNNLAEAAEMQASFIASGFDEQRCRYTVFDNSQGNRIDPFEFLNEFSDRCDSVYCLLVHQDIRADRGHGFEQLVNQLEALNTTDENWALAGNIGVTQCHQRAGRITDPNGLQEGGALPAAVISLDENLLVFRAAVPIRCSAELSGFHLYATDLCLQAYLQRRRCYAIDFHVMHFSGGNTSSDSFNSAVNAFRAVWQTHLTVAVIRTMCVEVTISRWRFAHYLLSFPRLKRWFIRRQCHGLWLTGHAGGAAQAKNLRPSLRQL